MDMLGEKEILLAITNSYDPSILSHQAIANAIAENNK